MEVAIQQLAFDLQDGREVIAKLHLVFVLSTAA